MTEQRQATIVGIFTLVALVVLCLLVFIFGGGRGLFASTYVINVHFPEGVVGVQQGQSVTLHGKRIGETTKVEFWSDRKTGEQKPEQGVNVVIAVDAEYDLPAASKVVVARSIMGFGRPAIQVVVQDPLDLTKLPRDGQAVIEGEMVEILDQLLPREIQDTLTQTAESLKDLAKALTPVAENLARLLEARDVKKVDIEELTANLDTVVQRLDSTLKNFNIIVGDEQNQANIGAILANTRTMSESGVVLMDDLRAMSDEGRAVLKDAGTMARRLAATADEMSAVLKHMDQTLAMMTDGQGTAALFLNDNRLYEEMVLTARRMTKMLDDLREVLDLAKRGELRIKAF